MEAHSEPGTVGLLRRYTLISLSLSLLLSPFLLLASVDSGETCGRKKAALSFAHANHLSDSHSFRQERSEAALVAIGTDRFPLLLKNKDYSMLAFPFLSPDVTERRKED